MLREDNPKIPPLVNKLNIVNGLYCILNRKRCVAPIGDKFGYYFSLQTEVVDISAANVFLRDFCPNFWRQNWRLLQSAC